MTENEHSARYTLKDGRQILIRPLAENDQIPELTALLHRAYARLAEMGLRFLATYQDDHETMRRISGSFCLVGLLDDKPVATVLLYPPGQTDGCEWYDRPDVACFGQFAVEPELQGRGLGGVLLRIIETRARNEGAAELALDTAETAVHLIEYYRKKGYRPVGHVQWPVTNYRSVVMSKIL